MAGNYPDPPAARLAYDRDGTLGFAVNPTTGVVSAGFSAALMRNLNDEDDDVVATGNAESLCLIFPALRDITHYFVASDNSNQSNVQVSSDTTNGYDGTWTTVDSGLGNSWVRTAKPGYRSPKPLAGATGIKAIRFQITSVGGITNGRYYRAVHLYGKPTNPSNRLEFWHPTLDQPLSDTPGWLDLGDRPRGTEITRQVRIKNLSATMTAQSVLVGFEALTDSSSPMTMTSLLSVSSGGSPDAATLTIPTLAQGETSPVLTIKQTLPADAPLSLWTQRVIADAGSWA